ncbi:MAG TPA: preprotein translocase subunit SecG [Anaerolineales bacterium]|nr:preprotein translocase subunit SecG [Anaerolineales bacterium]
MSLYFSVALILVALALVAVIVLQSRGAGLGGLTGGEYGGAGYHVRRGLERVLFNVTIGLSVVFFALALLASIFGG